MSQRAQQGLEATGPVQNLRIRFWGVQGSCPVHPPLYVIKEFTRQVAVHTLEQVLGDIAAKAKREGAGAAGGHGCVRVEDLLGGPPSEANVTAYQKKLGLPDF